MVNLQIRKILKIGGKNKSYAVTLPKNWINANKADAVFETWYNSVILIMPKNMDPDKKQHFINFLKDPYQTKLLIEKTINQLRKLDDINKIGEIIEMLEADL